MAGASPCQGLLEGVQLGITADKAGQATGDRRLQARPHRPHVHHLIHLHRGRQALDGHWPERLDRDKTLGQGQHCRGDQGRARQGHLLHAGSEMGGLPHRRVVHVQVTANGPHHHFSRVQPNADVDRHALRALHLSGVVLDGLLHAQRAVAGPHRVVFMGDRRTEQGHDAIAHDLVDRPLVAMHRLHHALQHRVQQLPGVLGVALGQEFHGASEVGKQHGHELALTFEGATEVRIFSAR